MATEVDRLVVVFDANFAALTEKLNKVLQKQEQAKKQIDAVWGKGLPHAAEKGFDNLAEHIGEAAKSIPVFGAALGALGPVGLAATVAVGGFVQVMEQTEKAVDYAAGIAKLATALGTTTDFVQEFNFAAKQSEVDVGAADAALKSLNAVIGSVQGNLPRARQLAVVFSKALNITPEQLRGYHDIKDLFPVIAEAVKNAGTAMEQAAIAKKFGMEELLPLLKQGKEGFNELALAAKDLGVVLSKESIEHAEEYKKKLNELQQVMDAQKTQTFVEYGAALLKLKSIFVEVEGAALHFLASLTGTLNEADKVKQLNETIRTHGMSATGDIFTAGVALAAAKKELADIKVTALNAIMAEAMMREGETAKLPDAPKFIPDKPGKEKKPPKDETLAFDKSAFDAYQTGLKDLTEAQKELTENVGQRASMEKQAVDDDTAKKVGDIDLEIAKIDKAILDKKINTHALTQKAELEAAKAKEIEAAHDKKIAIDRATFATEMENEIAGYEARAQLQAEALKAESEHLTATAALTTDVQNRATQERAALAKQQEAERVLADAKVEEAKAHLVAAQKLGDPDQIARAQIALTAASQARGILTGHQADVKAAQDVSLETPIQAYERSIKSLNVTMEEAGVQAAKSLADGLAEAIVNAKSLGDVATNVFKQIVTQIASALIEKNVTGPILKILSTGFASGTSYAPGGVALVGERGPELVNLPAGAQVIPNSALRNVGIGGATVVAPTFVFDNRGAVIWEQAARAMMAYADRAALGAGSAALSAARRTTPTDLARTNARRL